MGRQEGEQERDPVVAAIERVLKVERDGVEVLRQTEKDAQRLLSTAREQAASIARRADNCISKLHTAYLRNVELKIQGLKESGTLRGNAVDDRYDPETLAAAAQRLAAKLSGGA